MTNKLRFSRRTEPKRPYGESLIGGEFKNRNHQVVFFATSGSTGFMANGRYYDFSGADITLDELEIVAKEEKIPHLGRYQVISND